MTLFLTQLYAAVLPLVLTAIAALLARILASAATVAKERWGIEIEASHRAALHSALMSGVRAALSRGLSGQAAIDAAVEHTYRSVPDAIAHLGPTAGVLVNLANSKLREVIEKTPFVGLDFARTEGSDK